MPVLPIPVFGALVLGFLFLRMGLRDGRLSPLALLLGLCACQALIIALTQHYQLAGMRYVQPITATLIPPAAWMAFQLTAVRKPALEDLIHLAGPLCAIAAIVIAPRFLDVLIPTLFVGYGVAILRVGLRGPDAQPKMRLESGDLPARIWQIIAAALIASAFSDLLIVVAQLAGAPHWQPWIISLYSVGNLVLIGALSLSGALEMGGEEAREDAEEHAEEDRTIMARLDRLMADRRPYLDPDLTLAKLSRKLGIPAKTLSAAINRATGENVSRYVNSARIAEAKRLLAEGETVTGAMLAAGFNTKSNFNREFARVAGLSPSAWIGEAKVARDRQRPAPVSSPRHG